jgi:hypothetical protein
MPKPRAAQENHPPQQQQVSPQDPTACELSSEPNRPVAFHPATHPEHGADGIRNKEAETNQSQPAGPTHPSHDGLLRKEVIQPHLPVRLPCYDFVPIASPTFDDSPRHNRLGHRLRVLPTFVT